MTRLIPVELLPDSLWAQDESIMALPPQLIESWEVLLDKYGLRSKAVDRSPEGFVGGMSEEDTKNHLAWRFTGSSARVMLSMLDPKQELPTIPDVFSRIFSGNKVFIADLPCGSGAASMSILSTLCELRAKGKIPRMPLHVVVVGGEISEYAQIYAREAFASLIDKCEAQAIAIEFDTVDWNVCDKFSNTSLIRQLTLRSQDCSSKLLMLTNFSGFLQGSGKWKEANKQFDELFRHSQGDNSIALWLEPQTNKVTANKGGFMSRLTSWFSDIFKPNATEENIQEFLKTSSMTVRHPLTTNTFETRLAVVKFSLPERH